MTAHLHSLNRRHFLTGAASASLAGGLACRPARAQAPARQPNILFIFTDQERYNRDGPPACRCPATSGWRGRASPSPTTSARRRCAPRRARCMMTGLQTADNGMYENLDVPWMQSLSPEASDDRPHAAQGRLLHRLQGQVASVSREFDTKSVEQFMTPNMEKYGFADNFSPGDLIGHTLGGYSFDHITAGSAINWLRTKGRPLADDGKPWCMVVSFVNPHDIMYFNTDAPGEQVQDTGKLRLHAARAPEHALYKASWDVPIPSSLRQPFDAPGRPKAHARVRPHLGLYPGRHPARGRALEALQRLLHQLPPQRGPLGRGAARRARRARPGATTRSWSSPPTTARWRARTACAAKAPLPTVKATICRSIIIHPDVQGGQECKSLSAAISTSCRPCCRWRA